MHLRSLPLLALFALLAACAENRGNPMLDGGAPGRDLHSSADDLGSTPPSDLGHADVDLGAAGVDLGSPGLDLGSTDVDLGTAATGACTNAADQSTLATHDESAVVRDCATMSFGGEPATRDCIRSMTGLSQPCADCFDGAVVCSVGMCFSACAFTPDSAECTTCRMTMCDPAFEACSGLPPM